MPDILSDNKIKPIAFYLPQYHSIPENDLAWGKGFTEWTNVKKAKPLFPGHYQPRIPLDQNYYNLEDSTVMKQQSVIAKDHGIFGFCYYHYWFKNGKKLLEKPIENMLKDPDVDIPFCLCWANESWTKRWNGRDGEIIVEQDYGAIDDWKAHFNYLFEFISDSRYITLDGKPIIIIYKPDEIPCMNDMMECWQNLALENGLKKGLCFISQSSATYYNPQFNNKKFSYQIKFEPFFSYGNGIREKLMSVSKGLHMPWIYAGIQKIMRTKKRKAATQQVIDYDKVWNSILSHKKNDMLLEGAFVDWDNTPRTNNGYRTEGAAPEKFRTNLSKLFIKMHQGKTIPCLFINAWNEWAEGAYLEPDEKYGYKYLEALKSALEEYDHESD